MAEWREQSVPGRGALAELVPTVLRTSTVAMVEMAVLQVDVVAAVRQQELPPTVLMVPTERRRTQLGQRLLQVVATEAVQQLVAPE